MRLAYYPGCSLESTGLEYNLSAKLVAKHLNVQLWEIPEWNCCGASAAHSTDHLLALALPARNLALAEKEGLDVAVPCAACFSRLKATEKAVREDASTRETISEIIEMDYQGKNSVRPLVDVLVNGVGEKALTEKVIKPLSGLKVAAYYGCLLVRPPELTQFDDPEDPPTMENLVTWLGGEPVEWPFKVECCGAGHSTTKPEAGLPMIKSILEDAKDKGADCIICACPLCFLNLDMRQAQLEKRYHTNYQIPVFYFTQLMGLAMGYAPKELGLNKHFVDPIRLLEQKEILRHPSARREDT